MRLAREGLLLRRRPGVEAVRAAVEADVHPVDDDRLVVGDDMDAADIGEGAVVIEDAMGPEAADEASADIAEAVIDAAVKADMRSPIPGMPDIKPAAPAPRFTCRCESSR